MQRCPWDSALTMGQLPILLPGLPKLRRESSKEEGKCLKWCCKHRVMLIEIL